MAASETVTENNVGNSARCKEFSARDEKFILKSTHVKSFIYLFNHLFACFFVCLFIYLFIYYYSTRLTKLKLSTWTKNLHIIRPVDV